MREKLAAARWFPFQGRAEAGLVEGHQHEVAFGGEPFRRGFRHLGGGGEVDVAVGQIDRRAKSFPGGTEGIPFGAAEDLEDQHGGRIAKEKEPGNGLRRVIGLTPAEVMLL